jgi:uncharacterized membrane protein YdfJ with MMPL/SSD domain
VGAVLERCARVVVRFRLVVVGLWLAVLLAGALASTRLTPLLVNSFTVPGTESERARQILARSFGDRPDGAFTVVFRTPHARDRALQRRLHARVAAAARVIPTGRVRPARNGGGVVFVDVQTTLDLQHAKAYTGRLRAALRGVPPALVTGQPAVQHDLDPIFAADVRRGEAIALPLTLLILAAVLGISLAILIPFVFAACTIAASLGLVWLLAHDISMVAYVRNLVELVGLGLAIDYSLLIVHRFREEVAHDGDVDAAIARTMATAGRAVLFSGGAVAIGLGLLLFVPVPFIQSLGIGGLLVPASSMVAALTLQPALLSLLGRHISAPRPPGTFWQQLARRIMRRPYVALALGTAALLALALPALALRLTPGSLTGIPSSTESVRGYDALRAGLGGGVVTPTHVVIENGGRAATTRLVDALLRDREVLLVASGRRPPYAAGTYRRVIVATRHDWGDAATRRFVARLRTQLVPSARFPPGARVYAGGAPPQGVDFLNRTYGAFPWVVLGMLVLTYLALVAAFRSLLLPLKACVLNLLSVAAAYGVLSIVFRDPIEAWIPVLLFATLFGLSMDYEVFMVSRMRESWVRSGDNSAAVAEGLERTGRIVTAAAAVMVVAFLGFAAGRIEGLRQFGVGLAVAVALDATLVRAVLVPSLMAVLGRWNWWLPKRA